MLQEHDFESLTLSVQHDLDRYVLGSYAQHLGCEGTGAKDPANQINNKS